MHKNIKLNFDNFYHINPKPPKPTQTTKTTTPQTCMFSMQPLQCYSRSCRVVVVVVGVMGGVKWWAKGKGCVCLLVVVGGGLGYPRRGEAGMYAFAHHPVRASSQPSSAGCM